MDIALPLRPWRLPARAVDAAVVAGLLAVGALGLGIGASDHPRPGLPGLALVVLIAQAVPLLGRRRWPGTVLAITSAAAAARLWSGLPSSLAGAGLVAGIYSAGAYGRRRTRAVCWAVTVGMSGAGLVVFLLAASPQRLAAVTVPGVVFLGALIVGDSARARRARTAALEERAAGLEADREQQARAAVMCERARIARELHDLVAHHVSAIAVQAQAARLMITSQPGAAAAAIDDIQRASDQALSEMHHLLGLLRDEHPGALAPQPGLGQLGDLIARARGSGLTVELTSQDPPPDLPGTVSLCAYRIIQEALTNVRKHAGPASARVAVRYASAFVEVEVTDDGCGPAAMPRCPGSGNGLVGMRERAALFGGSLRAGPRPGGGYRVCARLPLRQENLWPSAS